MTDDQQDTIGNAAAIIERFGGIRPMAAKMNIPVTTVQGWKQRNAIPASRRNDIIQAAVQNRLDLGDLLIGITSEGSATGVDIAAPRTSSPPRRETFVTAVPHTDTTRPLIIGAVLLMAGALIGGIFALAPEIRTLVQQEEKVAALQAELNHVKQQQQTEPDTGLHMPSAAQQALTDLQTKVHDLSEQAKGYSTVMEDLKTGSVEQRIVKLEGHIHEMLPQTRALGLSGMLQKVQGMQQTPQGMSSLSGILNSMVQQMEGVNATTDPNAKKSDVPVDQSLQQLRETDPAVGDTLAGVAPEDMKAAAMLLGMSQLRQSLMRDNDSFDTDLKILKMTVAKDNQPLLDAIDRLAPQAQRGVLTPDGLSKEFRGLAGDVVAASLTGEDVSIEDKLKSRLNDVMVVEKNGQQISGTPTQKTISEAQVLLDKGDVPGAVALLNTLEGPAATKAQPFIEQAQATINAQQLQKLLGTNVLQQLKNTKSLHDPSAGVQPGVATLFNQVEGMIPGTGLFTDKDTGYSIYVAPPQITIPGVH